MNFNEQNGRIFMLTMRKFGASFETVKRCVELRVTEFLISFDKSL